MPLIDTSYFVGSSLNIPKAGIIADPVDKALVRIIKLYESEFLRGALGYDLYRSLMTALELDPTTGSYGKVTGGKAADDVDQVWKDLLNGKEYTGFDSRLRKWKGLVSLKDDSNQDKASPIAAYVFWKFMQATATQTTGLGEVAPTAENAAVISPRFRMATAWNTMHKEVKELTYFLLVNQASYQSWTEMDGLTAMKMFEFQNPFF